VSDVSHREVPCNAAGVGSSTTAVGTVATAVHTVGSTDTTWIEVFRHNGNNWWSTPDPTNNITLPDYIEAHNTGDLGGVFSESEAVTYANETNSSFTRYCVEAQVVELHSVTTPTDRTDDKEAGGFPTTSMFADDLSCATGNCFCMHYSDRKSRQPRRQLWSECPLSWLSENFPCNCPAERLAESTKHIGMVPFGTHLENGEVVIDGRWYSHPPGGHCAPGARIGDAGCTYRLSPLSHSLSLSNLFSKGVFVVPTDPARNLQLVRAAFDDLGAEPCGGAARTIHEQIMI